MCRFVPSLCPLNSQYHSGYLQLHLDIESLLPHPAYSAMYRDALVLKYIN